MAAPIAAADLPGAGESVLLAELHAALLRSLLLNAAWMRPTQRSPPHAARLLLQQLPAPECVTAVSWPEVLRTVLLLSPDCECDLERDLDVPREALQQLGSGEYTQLRPSARLALLHGLIDVWLSCWTSQQLLRARQATGQERAAEHTRRCAERDAARRAAELKEAMEQRAAEPARRVSNPHHSSPLPPLLPPVDPTRPSEASAAPAGGAREPSSGGPAGGAPGGAPGGADGGAPSLPCERETRALLAAISSGEERLLAEAVEGARTHRGVDGFGHWWTSELKEASAALSDVRRRATAKQREAAAAEERAAALEEHLPTLAECACREAPLGSDRCGRRYWHFAGADDLRLWVESCPHPAPASSAAGLAAGPTAGPSASWGFYHTAAQVERLLRYLDATGAEAGLRSALRARLAIWQRRWESAAGDDGSEGWVDEFAVAAASAGAPPGGVGALSGGNHGLLGQRVLRSFPGAGLVVGRVYAMLPKGAADNDEELYKVVHADGDSEELDGVEMGEALSAYEACASSAAPKGKGRTAGGLVLRQPKYANALGTGGSVVTVSAMGFSGVKAELGALEVALGSGLRRAGWFSGPRRTRWLKACKDARTVGELSHLLLQLEAAVYSLQTAADETEQRLWEFGHEWVGLRLRRFFPAAELAAEAIAECVLTPFDGRLTGWLPADGDDCALWHMAMDDGDEEELEEEEVCPAALPPCHLAA